MKSGTCEWHYNKAKDLSLIKLKPGAIKWKSAASKDIYENPFYACKRCIKRLEGMMEEVIEATTKETSIGAGGSSETGRLLNIFLGIKNIFPDLIDGIYRIPNSEFPDGSPITKKMNIVVSFRGLAILGYIHWATKENKSVLNLWNDDADRKKFWSEKLLRIILALGKIQSNSKTLNIWIRSFSRIMSIRAFTESPPRMEQISPKRLFKLTE